MPIVDTEKGAFTAAHCIEDLKKLGHRKFYGINVLGEKKKFRLIKSRLTTRGIDYAFLTDGIPDGIRLGDSTKLKEGQAIYLFSPKEGLSSGVIKTVPDPKYNEKIYISIGQQGESGSGVYNDSGELIGIFVARTGDPRSPSGVMIPIHVILKDI